jgi:hypothetical protein
MSESDRQEMFAVLAQLLWEQQERKESEDQG